MRKLSIISVIGSHNLPQTQILVMAPWNFELAFKMVICNMCYCTSTFCFTLLLSCKKWQKANLIRDSVYCTVNMSLRQPWGACRHSLMGTFPQGVIGSSWLLGISSIYLYCSQPLPFWSLLSWCSKWVKQGPNSDINLDQGIDWTRFLKKCECSSNSALGKSDMGKSYFWEKK